MFEIKREARMDLKEQLLYNIWQELKNLNQALSDSNGVLAATVPFAQAEELSNLTESKTSAVTGLFCKHCSGYHKKTIDIVNCGKKLKKG